MNGQLVAEFTSIPQTANMDGVIGLSNGTSGSYTDLAAIIRFNTNGTIDAVNGSSYSATNSISYSAGRSYLFRLEVDLGNHVYDAYVTPSGGSTRLLADNFSFRSEQSSVNQLNNLGMYVTGTSGSVQTCDFTINSSTTLPGDANSDGSVDGIDYTVWFNNYNTTTASGLSKGDFNNDNRVDGLDYVVWLNHYMA